MAAPTTVTQGSLSRKSPINRTGVLTLYGYGIKIRMQAGHLEMEHGIGPERRKIRLARVGHGLKRLVCISEDGFTTLSALKWLADVGASFVMLSRTGRVLFVTGPTAPRDVRLRRAQALAHSTGAALRIARELIDKKLAGQEHVARRKLRATDCADTVHCYRSELAEAETIERIRLVESLAASAYWSAWRELPINFPRKDQARIPAHWRVFGARVSPLTGSPRVAVNPLNAMLNLLYSLLESESRLAAATLGLDPGLGVLHTDTKARDSLACDLMEPVRAQVDAFLLDWVLREPFKREWFFEDTNGNCRLTASFAAQLCETAPMWGRGVAPYAEWTARKIWSSISKSTYSDGPATRLTQRHKRQAKGKSPLPPMISAPRRENLCRQCGEAIGEGSIHCPNCAIEERTPRFRDVARLGRATAHTAEARAREGLKQRRHATARSEWTAADLPAWLTAESYREKIRPLLTALSNGEIASQIGVSRWYAWRIRKGHIPHPLHWKRLAQLVGALSQK